MFHRKLQRNKRILKLKKIRTWILLKTLMVLYKKKSLMKAEK